MRHTFSLTVLILTCVITGVANGQERDQPRSQERDQPRSQERDQPREGQTTDRDIRFQPQNDRERALMNMIQQLRSEVADLRRQVANRDRDRSVLSGESGSRNFDRREGDRGSENRPTSNPLMKQTTRIFAAYDKNRDQRVSFEEWLSMREGEMTSERRSRELGVFSQQAGDDRLITLEEFYRAMVARTRGTAPREDSARDRGPRESDTRDRGPRESDTRDQPRDRQEVNRDVHFQPQNDRERVLWNMIQQLRSE